jgi:hypothetical protein
MAYGSGVVVYKKNQLAASGQRLRAARAISLFKKPQPRHGQSWNTHR